MKGKTGFWTLLFWLAWTASGLAATIVYIPMDNRPVNLEYVMDSAKAAQVEVLAPPAAILAGRQQPGETPLLWRWLEEQAPYADALVLSADSLIYGGLVSSRTHGLNPAELLERVEKFRQLRQRFPSLPVYVFGTVMRTPQMSAGATEPAYYETYGPQIFRITALEDKAETEGLSLAEKVELAQCLSEVPASAMEDWRQRRKRNLQVNLWLQQAVRDGMIDLLLLGRDDSSPYSASNQERRWLDTAAADLANTRYVTLPGADNLGMALLVRATHNHRFEMPFVRVFYAPGRGAATIASYEDLPLGTTIPQHIRLMGGLLLQGASKTDLVLAVNSPMDGRTREAADPINQSTASPKIRQFVDQVAMELKAGNSVAIGDVAFANGADNALIEELRQRNLTLNLAAYSGWNTAGNTLGYAIGQGMLSMSTAPSARIRLLAVRYLDDWAYQANVRSRLLEQIVYPRGNDGQWLNALKPLVVRAAQKEIGFYAGRLLGQEWSSRVEVDFPWNRMFEVSVKIREGAR